MDEKTENEHALYSPIEESERRLGLDENISGGKEGEGRSDSSNILDDMEKFQREVEALSTHLGRPLTGIPDPFGTHPRLSSYMSKQLVMGHMLCSRL